MKDLKELYWKDVEETRRIKTYKNRKGMIYAAKFYNVRPSKVDYHTIGKELVEAGYVQGCYPQYQKIMVGDGTLVIIHVKENSKLWGVCKEIGYEKGEVA